MFAIIDTILRMDWEPSNDLTFSLSHGYAWARNINITGIARYLADGWVYRYYQAKTRYKNLFFSSVFKFKLFWRFRSAH